MAAPSAHSNELDTIRRDAVASKSSGHSESLSVEVGHYLQAHKTPEDVHQLTQVLSQSGLPTAEVTRLERLGLASLQVTEAPSTPGSNQDAWAKTDSRGPIAGQTSEQETSEKTPPKTFERCFARGARCRG